MRRLKRTGWVIAVMASYLVGFNVGVQASWRNAVASEAARWERRSRG